jgi:hypothetical protein
MTTTTTIIIIIIIIIIINDSLRRQKLGASCVVVRVCFGVDRRPRHSLRFLRTRKKFPTMAWELDSPSPLCF